MLLPARRRKASVWIVATLVMTVAIVLYARFIEPAWIDIEDVTVALPGLDPRMESLNIVFVADLHVGRVGGRERKLVRELRRIEPDLILVGGDFIHSPFWRSGVLRNTAWACSLLAEVPTRYGIYAVFGNNDYPDMMTGIVEESGIRLLTNEWVRLAFVEGELTLLGIDDPVTGRDDWVKAFADDPREPVLTMLHSPDGFAEAVRRKLPFVLAGHTHGGQIVNPLLWLAPSWSLRLKPETPPYRAGMYELDGCRLYVTRGIGNSYVDARFLCRPEITRVHLRAAS